MYALPDASPLIDVEFSDVSVRLPGGRVALKNATGALRAGRLAAIIGPSGAGKSTLLDLLAGRAPPPGSRVRGSVLLNGAAPSLCHPALVGYVPQDDGALLGWLTVRELLRFYAVRPRRPSFTPPTPSSGAMVGASTPARVGTAPTPSTRCIDGVGGTTYAIDATHHTTLHHAGDPRAAGALRGGR